MTVEAETGDEDSTLELYRRALAARRQYAGPNGGETVELLDLGADVLAFRRDGLTVVLNCGDEPTELPAGEVVLTSEPLSGRTLPANTAAWLI